jgi:hypothetical protein
MPASGNPIVRRETTAPDLSKKAGSCSTLHYHELHASSAMRYCRTTASESITLPLHSRAFESVRLALSSEG